MRQRWIWRLIWSAVTRQRRGRTVLVAAALGAAVLAAMSSLYLGMGFRLSQDLRAYGANLTVTSAVEGAPLEESALEAALASIDAGERMATATYLQGLVNLTRPGAGKLTRAVRAVLIGTDAPAYAGVKPYLIVEGRWPERPDEILVGADVAAALKLEAGEQVAVAPSDGSPATLIVSGLVISGGAEDDQVVVSLQSARELFHRTGELDGALLSVGAGPPRLTELASQLVKAYPALAATPRGQVVRAEEKVQRSLGTLFLLLTSVIGVAAMLCLYTTMVAMASERQGEIGLKKALGASAPAICREFLTEAAVLGLGGGLLGLVLGQGLARTVGQVAFSAPQNLAWPVVPLTFLVTPLVTMTAAWGPVRHLTQSSPITALRGENR